MTNVIMVYVTVCEYTTYLHQLCELVLVTERAAADSWKFPVHVKTIKSISEKINVSFGVAKLRSVFGTELLGCFLINCLRFDLITVNEFLFSLSLISIQISLLYQLWKWRFFVIKRTEKPADACKYSVSLSEVLDHAYFLRYLTTRTF